MLDQDPDALIAVSERMDPEDFAVAPMPLGPAGKAFPSIGYAGWAMFDATEHRDESWALISHLSSRESNLDWSKFVGVIPIHKGADQDPFFATEQFAGWFTEMNDPAGSSPRCRPIWRSSPISPMSWSCRPGRKPCWVIAPRKT